MTRRLENQLPRPQLSDVSAYNFAFCVDTAQDLIAKCQTFARNEAPNLEGLIASLEDLSSHVKAANFDQRVLNNLYVENGCLGQENALLNLKQITNLVENIAFKVEALELKSQDLQIRLHSLTV